MSAPRGGYRYVQQGQQQGPPPQFISARQDSNSSSGESAKSSHQAQPFQPRQANPSPAVSGGGGAVYFPLPGQQQRSLRNSSTGQQQLQVCNTQALDTHVKLMFGIRTKTGPSASRFPTQMSFPTSETGCRVLVGSCIRHHRENQEKERGRGRLRHSPCVMCTSLLTIFIFCCPSSIFKVVTILIFCCLVNF